MRVTRKRVQACKLASIGPLKRVCDIPGCRNDAVVDCPTKMGPFGYLCFGHIDKYARVDWQISARRIVEKV